MSHSDVVGRKIARKKKKEIRLLQGDNISFQRTAIWSSRKGNLLMEQSTPKVVFSFEIL